MVKEKNLASILKYVFLKMLLKIAKDKRVSDKTLFSQSLEMRGVKNRKLIQN